MNAARALLFLILLHSLLLFPLVSSVDTLNPGETLNSTSYLVSTNGTFTLGFYRNQNSNNSYLGIWYSQQETPVWLANRDIPITQDSGILTITNSSGTVHIMHSEAADPIRLYTAESGTNNLTATLLDSGNFVIQGTTNSSGGNLVVLWQSFDYPTDTLLMGMKLGVNHRTGLNWTLTSWFSAANPASGAFTLDWDPSTRRLLIKRRGVIYWTSGDLRLYRMDGDLEVYAFDNIVPPPDAWNLNYLYRNVSNQDEDYFAYSLWIDSFTPDNRRTVSGWTMRYDGHLYDPDRLAIAQVESCYGYNFRDRSNVYSGCELWSQPTCRNRNQNFTELYGYFDNFNLTSESNLSISDCRANCWNDCLCAAYSTFEPSGCSYWRGENMTFRQDNAAMSQRRYVLVTDDSGNVPEETNEGRNTRTTIIAVATVASLILILGISSFIIVRKLKLGRRRKKELKELMVFDGYTGETNAAGFEHDGNDNNVRLFSHATILASTNSFSSENKLGEGGFGPVYKGKLPERHEIAVKLMTRRREQGLVEFKTELVLISKLQHRNLVKLLGFCIHGNDKMIVYDYMPNRSLDFFLFDSENREQLNWETRFNIIEGIAQGLLYLHKYSRLLVIHRDLKPANILLDENMNRPKISDFGLARIFKQNTAEANTTKRPGTLGYMAPEYIAEGIISVKSDIYSFGVILLEIMSGRKNSSFRDIEGPLTLAEFAWEQWKLCAELDIMDQTLERGSVTVKDQVKRCIQVGLLCVQDRASDRPLIEDVVSMLKNETSSLPKPNKPAFILTNGKVPIRVIPRPPESQNEASYSTFNGR